MNLRDKAREVKVAGEAERGNFTPHGVPKRIYQWWLNESRSPKANKIRSGQRRENFCHFWRVVLLWAPLRKLGLGIMTIAPFVGGLFVLLGLVAIVYTAFTNPLDLLAGAAFILGVILGVLGILAGISAGLTPSQRKRYDLIYGQPLLAVLLVVGFYTAIPAYIITRSLRFYNENLTAYHVQIFLTLAGLVLVGGATWIGIDAGLGTLLFVVGVIAATFAGLLALIWLATVASTYIQGKRSIAEANRLAAEQEYINAHGELPVREPSRFEKIFDGFLDFVVLLAQVVRVKKWKICPIVEIDT